MTESVILIERLTKVYRTGLMRRSVRAVDELSLSIERGAVVGLLGPNGAGKTTTIYCLLGLLKPSAGSIALFGHQPGRTESRRNVGYLSEIFYTYPYLTGEAALWFYGSLSGIAASVLERAVPVQLKRLGLAEAATRKVKTFSKGMVQRLGLAQALLHEPDLLILDEPTTGLDPAGRKLVVDVMLEEKKRGTTIFFSSHILSDVERVCDRVVIIQRGRAIVSAGMDELLQHQHLWMIEVMGWRPEFADRIQGAEKVAEENGTLWVFCLEETKSMVLRQLLDLPVEIGAVRRAARSLEELYMEAQGRMIHE